MLPAMWPRLPWMNIEVRTVNGGHRRPWASSSTTSWRCALATSAGTIAKRMTNASTCRPSETSCTNTARWAAMSSVLTGLSRWRATLSRSGIIRGARFEPPYAAAPLAGPGVPVAVEAGDLFYRQAPHRPKLVARISDRHQCESRYFGWQADDRFGLFLEEGVDRGQHGA